LPTLKPTKKNERVFSPPKKKDKNQKDKTAPERGLFILSLWFVFVMFEIRNFAA
jgi:hypothetical protein